MKLVAAMLFAAVSVHAQWPFGGGGGGRATGLRRGFGAPDAGLCTINTLGGVYFDTGSDTTYVCKSSGWSNIATTTGGTGDVVGPGVAVDSNIALFDTTTGKAIKDGGKGIPAGAIVGTTDTQTLTNKTLTAPVINSPTGIVKADVGLGNVANVDTTNASNLASGTVGTARLGSGTANSTTFLRGDGTWNSPAGSGDVVGPASSTDSRIVLFDGTTGKLVKVGAQGLPAGTIVGTTDTQTLTNKTLTAPAITSPTGIVKADVGLSNVANVDTTSASNISSGTLPAARLPAPTVGTKGGVESLTCSGTDKLSAIGTDGIPVCAADATTAPAGNSGEVQINSSGSFGALPLGGTSPTHVVGSAGARTDTALLVYNSSGNAIASGCSYNSTTQELSCGDGTLQARVNLKELAANGTDEYRIYGPSTMAAVRCIYFADDQAGSGEALIATGNTATIDGATCREVAWSAASGMTDPGGNGVVVRTASNTTTNRTITGTANEITLTNGDGVSGNPTASLAATFDISGKTSTKPVKSGTAAPGTCSVGELFFDTDATAGQNLFACTATNTWTLQGGGSVSSSSGSSTDNNIVTMDGTGGATIQDSGVAIASVPSAGEKSALAGTTGTPGASNKYVTETDIQMVPGCSPSGGSDTYACTGTPTIAQYDTGRRYRFLADVNNTGAATINFTSLGAKTIKKVGGGITTDLSDNDIRAGQWVEMIYDGTNMQMTSQLGNSAAAGGGAFLIITNVAATMATTSRVYAGTNATGWNSSATNKTFFVTRNCTGQKLYVRSTTTMPASETIDFTIYNLTDNTNLTGLTVQFTSSEAATEKSDTSGSISLVAGKRYAFSALSTSATTSASFADMAFECTF